MNTAQPASLAPGVSGSGGTSRSPSASTADPSSGEKNSHGPGRTGAGGAPASGAQGMPPAITRAPAGLDDSRRASPVLVKRSRRLRDMLASAHKGPLRTGPQAQLMRAGKVPESPSKRGVFRQRTQE